MAFSLCSCHSFTPSQTLQASFSNDRFIQTSSLFQPPFFNSFSSRIASHTNLPSNPLTNNAFTKPLPLNRNSPTKANLFPSSKQAPNQTKATLSSEAKTAESSQTETKEERRERIEKSVYDAVIIGSGIGGIVTASQLAKKGAKVLVLEKYVIPGGSSGAYEREGYTFDVGSSVMFGLGAQGNVNLITRALASVDRKLELIEDPTAVHYHMPNELSVKVHRNYQQFLDELVAKFPHEEKGIRMFYDECWTVFNALNALELKSLEEPLYLFGQFFKNPIACLTLAYYLPQNAGDIAKKYIKDKNVLSFIDAECFIVSTVNSCNTPMINAAMVLCDRHYGGINYPVGGVGKLSEELIIGLENYGGEIMYKAEVVNIIMQNGKATGVKLSNGMTINAKNVISNATRWDTFDKLIPSELVPPSEKEFKNKYKKSPSFLSIHMGVDENIIPKHTECHHLILETEWSRMEIPYETIFLSIPTLLDPSLAPPQKHILHIFTTSFIDEFENLPRSEYVKKKELLANKIIERLEKELFPGLKSAIAFKEVGTPKTHRRFLAREDGTYGPIPARKPMGLLAMPFNTTDIENLYCVGDSCFPGQGVIAVAFSGIMCAHRIAANLGIEKRSPLLDSGLSKTLKWLRSLA